MERKPKCKRHGEQKTTRSVLIADQTGTLELSLWGDAIEKVET